MSKENIEQESIDFYKMSDKEKIDLLFKTVDAMSDSLDNLDQKVEQLIVHVERFSNIVVVHEHNNSGKAFIPVGSVK